MTAFDALPTIETNVPLSRLTTLAVGGPARSFVICRTAPELLSSLDWARHNRLPTFILGGGSNLLVADEGFHGLIIQMADDSIEIKAQGAHALLHVGAGVEWDRLVALAVDEKIAGIECLSGIPGLVGAAPIQNIGAYGQDVSETIEAAWAVERSTGTSRCFANSECGFGYRTSHFKTLWNDRYVITRVDFRGVRGNEGAVRYADLERRFQLSPMDPKPSLAAVRQAVLELRRSKSMVLDPEDPNCHSAGSFFMNPVVSLDLAERVRAIAARTSPTEGPMPQFPATDGLLKLSAAWLIERAGFRRGFILGRAGLSTRHALALINRGDARAADLVALASLIRRTVRELFGVTLQPEPVFLGFDRGVDELLG